MKNIKNKENLKQYNNYSHLTTENLNIQGNKGLFSNDQQEDQLKNCSFEKDFSEFAIQYYYQRDLAKYLELEQSLKDLSEQYNYSKIKPKIKVKPVSEDDICLLVIMLKQ